MKVACALVVIAGLGASTAQADDEGGAAAASRRGFTATAGVGMTVGTPFVELQVGRRLSGRARHGEVYLDYSYNAAISAYPFHTIGVGLRTYFPVGARLELFHQAMVGTAIAGGGHEEVTGRDLGQRLLGAFTTQGLGAQLHLTGDWAIAAVVSTGYPVWLRPELTVRYTF